MRRIDHSELREERSDVVDLGRPDEALVVQHRDALAVGEDAEIGIVDTRLQRAQLVFAVCEHGWILDRDEAVVHAFRARAAGHGVMHQAARHVRLAHRAARPRRDLGGQDGPHAQLLTYGDQQCVHSRRIGCGQFREVADPHQHFRHGILPPDFRVPFERGHEAEADRLEDRVDEIADAPLFQLLEAGLQRVERAAEIGYHHHTRARAGEIACDLQVRPFTLNTSWLQPTRPADLIRIERVDADAHSGAGELRTTSPSDGRKARACSRCG